MIITYVKFALALVRSLVFGEASIIWAAKNVVIGGVCLYFQHATLEEVVTIIASIALAVAGDLGWYFGCRWLRKNPHRYPRLLQPLAFCFQQA